MAKKTEESVNMDVVIHDFKPRRLKQRIKSRKQPIQDVSDDDGDDIEDEVDLDDYIIDDTKESVNDRIRRVRLSRGMTQREFAEALEVNQQCVANWEGKRVVPTPQLFRIAQTFNINQEWLRSGDGEMTAKVEIKNDDTEAFVKVASDILNALPRDKKLLVMRLAMRFIQQNANLDM